MFTLEYWIFFSSYHCHIFAIRAICFPTKAYEIIQNVYASQNEVNLFEKNLNHIKHFHMFCTIFTYSQFKIRINA